MKKLLFLLACAGLLASCNMPNNAGNEKAATNKAKMQRFYDEVMNAHNPAAIDSFCTADFVDHNPDEGHSGQGLDDAKASFTAFFAAFPDLHVTTNFMAAEGDTVMAHLTMTGTNSGAMGPMPATNKSMKIDGIDCVAIKDGKATQRWGFFDGKKMMEDLGMMPPPPAPPDSAKMMSEKK